jgi:hypothetical protein
MTYQYTGNCRCAQVSFLLTLPNPLEHYQARACDCDFCTARRVAYLSDNKAWVSISGESALKSVRQGSEQAEFQLCSNCGDLVLVSYLFDTGLKGAVNAALLDSFSLMDKPVSVSPKKLSASEKLIRWEGVWLAVQLGQHNS